LRARLASLNPGARLLEASRGEATAATLLDAGLFDPANKSPDVSRWLNAQAFALMKPNAHRHDHDVNRHDERIRAFCLTGEKPMRASGFELFLDLLRQAHGPRLLRVKGIVCLDDDPARPVVIHGVQHIFHPPVRLDRWPDSDHRTRIVFILRDLDPGFVEGLWKAFAGETTIDRPDSEAIVRNPLKPATGGLLG
jgi:G3E family GTPase